MLTSAERIALIHERLTTALAPTHLEIIDESYLHKGHAGAKTGAGHFAIEISSKTLADKNAVQAHRLIYAALNDLIPKEIHALRIKIINAKGTTF